MNFENYELNYNKLLKTSFVDLITKSQKLMIKSFVLLENQCSHIFNHIK
jgi:hypothetical protein